MAAQKQTNAYRYSSRTDYYQHSKIGRKMHKNVSIIILILIFSAACNQPLSEKQQTIETAKENFQHTLQVKTFNTEIGWGYDIYIDGKKLIHQLPKVSNWLRRKRQTL